MSEEIGKNENPVNSSSDTQTLSESSKSMDNNTTNDDNQKSDAKQPNVKTETKDNSKYRTVESRYKQSTQTWVNRRTDDNSLNKSNEVSVPVIRSRNPTPTSKGKQKKASTPLSTDKSLNCSGVSVINRAVNQKTSEKPVLKINKFGKGFSGRRSLAPRQLGFGVGSSSAPMVMQKSCQPMTVGIENETKNKEIEKSVLRATYLQTLFLKLKANEVKSERKTNAVNKMSQIWSQTNQIRAKISKTQEFMDSLKHTMNSIESLEKQKISLNKYLTIRSEMDVLFSHLSELIAEQKQFLKIENCSENDFKELNELLRILPNYGNSDSFEKLSKSSLNIENSKNTLLEMNCLENEFKDYYQKLTKLAEDMDKYQRIESSIKPEISLKKLF